MDYMLLLFNAQKFYYCGPLSLFEMNDYSGNTSLTTNQSPSGEEV